MKALPLTPHAITFHVKINTHHSPLNTHMLTPIIMAGGTGSRLWPLSRELNPKQFLPLVDAQYSMLQLTLQRLAGVATNEPYVVCHEEHRFLAAEQLRQLGYEQTAIILEPMGRNTAPAIALAALQAQRHSRGDDPILLVLAADHAISDITAFEQSIATALPLAESGKLVTFGITPTHAHTGYGYLEQGASLGNGGFVVRQFVEKPDLATANIYLTQGNYFWNSGMFMFRASRYLAELAHFAPAILEACQQALANGSQDMNFIRVELQAFATCPNISIDYAVMEHTQSAVMVPLEADWSDIGAWSTLWERSEKDAQQNAFSGDVIAHDTQRSYVHADSRLVATLGVEDLVIIETADALLVAHQSRTQDIKHLVDQLQAAKRPESQLHQTVYRPWGKYESIGKGPGYQVKRITVQPHAKLSLQTHRYRAEHWIVVSGTARVTLNERIFDVGENQSTYIPIGALHALENPTDAPLELIEVQSGAYLGEDDIVRYVDQYGRT